ncbi:MAG: hypothetical protein IKM31_08900 [Oscillospiraceae bacterium]|nr:hypothetical protein [Oscillospiraceae bacterium]
MKTLVIYDQNGRVLLIHSGRNIPDNAGVAVAEVPEGMEVGGVDAGTGEVILKEREKTAGEQLETLKRAAAITAAGFTDEQAAKVPELYPVWKAGEEVAAGDRRSYGGNLYKAVQGHATQAGWEPDKVPALWEKI